MEFLVILPQALSETLRASWTVLANGGWFVYVYGFTWMAFRFYMNKINGDFIGSQEYVFLQVKVEKENLQSTMAVEQIFTQMHAIHSGFSWAETYLEGKVNLWVSLEIVSLGGKISYIIRTPKQYRHLIESSFYARYPLAEISEVGDYMEHLKHWDAHHSTWDLWGTEYLLLKDYAYPIKTYREFEHPAAEETIIDPITGLIEGLSKLEPYELMVVQVVIRPLADKDWQPHCEEVVKELKKEAVHKSSIWGTLLSPVTKVGKKNIFEAMREMGSHGDEDTSNAPIMQRLSEGEKKVILGIETKMTKPAWDTKIRNIYIAPKDKFDGTKKTSIIGAFRQLSYVTSNSLKPDMNNTWTRASYILFRNIEKPLLDMVIEHKKHLLLKGFVNRSMWVGAPPMIFNSEELATIFHFPISSGLNNAPVERIDVKRGQPPANLPIA